MSIVCWRCWKAALSFHRGETRLRGAGAAQLCSRSGAAPRVTCCPVRSLDSGSLHLSLGFPIDAAPLLSEQKNFWAQSCRQVDSKDHLELWAPGVALGPLQGGWLGDRRHPRAWPVAQAGLAFTGHGKSIMTHLHLQPAPPPSTPGSRHPQGLLHTDQSRPTAPGRLPAVLVSR